MRATIFCNVGWMSWYKGLAGRPDKIVGGGRWVDENKTGGEVCNFHACPDGYVYGHVETIRGKRIDRYVSKPSEAKESWWTVWTSSGRRRTPTMVGAVSSPAS